MNSTDCIFCKVARGEIAPGTKVRYEDKEMIAFDDRSPSAPVHVLIIPKKHIASFADIKKEDEGLLGRICYRIKLLAEELGLSRNGYRVTVNVGKWGGQVVPHLHFHLLGGAPLNENLADFSHNK